MDIGRLGRRRAWGVGTSQLGAAAAAGGVGGASVAPYWPAGVRSCRGRQADGRPYHLCQPGGTVAVIICDILAAVYFGRRRLAAPNQARNMVGILHVSLAYYTRGGAPDIHVSISCELRCDVRLD